MPGVGAGIGFAKACVGEVDVGAEDVVGEGDWVEELVGIADGIGDGVVDGVADGVGVTEATGLLPEDLEAELEVCFAFF
jgi:hypothetical protein